MYYELKWGIAGEENGKDGQCSLTDLYDNTDIKKELHCCLSAMKEDTEDIRL